MTPKELAAAIRKGHTMIGETMQFMHSKDENPCGCALTAAWYGSGKTHVEYWDGWLKRKKTGVNIFIQDLCIPEELAVEVSNKHCSGMKRLEIAGWLDTLPDDTAMPPKVERESDEAYAARMVRQITEAVTA